MEQLIEHILTDYSYLVYPVILAWTFLEGETIVLLTGAVASEGRYHINVELMALCAFLGSFTGDQAYYYIGRSYGTPLLKRWPNLTKRIDWAFRLVQTHQNIFILTFRFIYGVRNISPFVIGMAGVGRLKYFVLNMIAALVWAHSFAWGGYILGRALEQWLGTHKGYFLAGFVAVVAVFALVNWLRSRRAAKAAALAAAAAAAQGEPTALAAAPRELSPTE